MSEDLERPWASELEEESARGLRPHHKMTPEEFVARFSQDIGCFSLHTVRYSDPELDAWILRLGRILVQAPGTPSIESLRKQFLTPQEMEYVLQREKEEF